MRVFIYGTGRCGTVCIARALAHAENYTVAHETVAPTWEWPDDHIEVNPQLRVLRERLPLLYPDALCVWLHRPDTLVWRSYARLDGGNWLRTWWSFAWTMQPPDPIHAAQFAVAAMIRDCQAVWVETAPAQRMSIGLTSADRDEQFERLWRRIGARGDLAAALRDWNTVANSSEERGDA